MHSVNGAVIKPRTQEAGGMSWALMLSHEGLDGEFFFVTHSWKEGVYEFSRKVVNHWQRQDLSMWCCFLANPQTWDREELNKLLGGRFDLSDSPFMLALSASQLHSFVVVPNVTESLYCRLWCVAELWKAMEVEKQRGSPLIFVAKDTVKKAPDTKGGTKDSISTMIQHATCSDENDEKRIRAYIQGNEHHLQDEIKNLAIKAKEREKMEKMEEKKKSRSSQKHRASRGRGKLDSASTFDRLEAQLAEISSSSFEASRGEESERAAVAAVSESGVIHEVRLMTVVEHHEERRMMRQEPVERQAPMMMESAAIAGEEEREVHRQSLARFREEMSPAEEEKRMFQQRLHDLRMQTESQRHADDETERLLFEKIQLLSQQLSDRRQSIEVRHHKETEREATLRRQIQATESATIEELHMEILLRKEAAEVREKCLEEEAERLKTLREKGDPSNMPQKDEVAECLASLAQRRISRIQLESLLESGEGEEALRQYLGALKHAEFDDFMNEVKLHRQSDEATEAFLGSEVESLGAELRRHKLESDQRRAQAQRFEEEIVMEMERLQKLQNLEEQSRQKESEFDERRAGQMELLTPIVHTLAHTVELTEVEVPASEPEAKEDVGTPIGAFVMFGFHSESQSLPAPVVCEVPEVQGAAGMRSPTTRESAREEHRPVSTRGSASPGSESGSDEETEAGIVEEDEDDRLNDLFDI